MAKQMTFRTGEFAEITGVNKRTLHFYDQEGIFRPDSIRPNGYRSYSYKQVYPFYLIRMLRSMGLDLKEIKAYMARKSPRELTQLLVGQEAWLDEEIRRLQRMKTIVRHQRQRAEAGGSRPDASVRIEEWPEMTLFLSAPLRDFIIHDDDNGYDQAFVKHIRYAMEHDIYTGYNAGSMVCAQDYRISGNEEYWQYLFLPTDIPFDELPEGYRLRRPAGHYLVTYLRGDYEATGPAYGRLRQYWQERQITPVGYSYEEGFIDEISALRTDDFLTRIAVRIEEEQ